MVVKITEANLQLESAACDLSSGKTGARTQQSRSGLPPPNAELIREARDQLRHDYELNLEHSERIYSKYHYDEIMEAGAPFTCWRYLLHCDEQVDAAVELMKATMKWREENNVDSLQVKDMIKDIWLRSPIGFTGKTRDGHDLVYAIGKNFRKPSTIIKQTIRDFVAHLLFEWDRKHRYDLEQIVIVFDTTDTGLRNIDLDFSAWLVSIRDFIPSRINALYFVGIPFIIRPIIRLIISWLPEKFKRIAHCGTWDELVAANISEDNLPEEVGGLADNSWRLAPVDAKWAHEIHRENTEQIFAKICEACSFNMTEEKIERLYKMQQAYEKKLAEAN